MTKITVNTGKTLKTLALIACLGALPLVVGLLLAFGALLLRLHGLAFGEPQGSAVPVQASYLPMVVHLALVLVAGIWLPAPLVAWFNHVAALLG